MMYTKRLALIAVLHGMQCAAQMDNSYPMSGTNGTAPYEGSSTFLKAAQSPNASHTVSFAHYYDNSMAAISTDPKLNNWTWTVKVSEAQLPNISAYHPNLTHVAYTTYELSWPEQGGLNSALAAEAKAGNNGAGYPSCAYLVTAQFPENISKKWDGSSNCTSALGANCTETLTKMLSSGSSCEVGFALDNPDFIAACKSSFGSTEGDGWGIKPFMLGSANNTGTSSMSPGKNQTFAYYLSEPYMAGNMTIFEETANNLQVLALTGSHTNLLCNRAGDGKSIASAASTRTVGWASLISALFLAVAFSL